MKALLVIDMQEDYIGEKRDARRFPYHSEILIPRINQKISDFSRGNNFVVYVLNRFFYQSRKFVPQIVEGLQIVSDKIFLKNRASCFSNSELIRFLSENHVTAVEMAGVDGNYCVAASARAGLKNGLSVVLNRRYVEAAKADRLEKTIGSLQKAGVTIQE